jgi:DNA-binding XRE family transcriptional regulator
MAERTHQQTRRALSLASGQTDGNTSRKKLAGPESRNGPGRMDSGTRPPSKLELAQQKLGQKIRGLREKKALTEQRLGYDCGISATKIKKIEAGTVDPGVCTLIRIAERLQAKLTDLFGGVA